MLKCQIYPVGTQLITQGDEVDTLYFIYKGTGLLTSDLVSDCYKRTRLEVATLPEGSFFGELPLLLGITVFFNLTAGPKDTKSPGEKIVRDRYEQALFYTIDKETLEEICSDYPEFKTMIYIRAEIRVAYFKHLNMLRKGEFGYNMKVLEIENKIKKTTYL